jgi:hypothetical protein
MRPTIFLAVSATLFLGSTTALAQVRHPPATSRRPVPLPSRPTFLTSWRGFDTGRLSVARWPYAAKVADFEGTAAST